MEEKLSWIWFNLIRDRFRKKADDLYEKVRNINLIYRGNIRDYVKYGVTDIKFLEVLCDKDLTCAKREIWYAENYNTEIIPITDKEYPNMLKEIKNPPLILYRRGNIDINNEKCIAVVGTRKVSEKGADDAYKAAYTLAKAGITVVSGMAAGVDTHAHKGAIDAGGKTVAVFGCGVGTVYPAENKALMREILENGCIYSEYCFESIAFPTNFPQRNRIISGISESVIVMEADIKSGSIITARHAAEQGKNLYAISRYVEQNKELDNTLKELGANIINDVDELVENGQNQTIEECKTEDRHELDDEHRAVIDLIKSEPKSCLEIAEIINKNTVETGILLTMMEIEGLVIKSAKGMYSIAEN